MKKNKIRKIVAVLIVVVMCAVLVNPMTVEAASPKLNITKKTLVGVDKSFNLSIKNKVKGMKVKWYSTNKKVISVESDGRVTSEGKGTAYAKCKITYKNKKTKILSCKVTVKVPSQNIYITNSVEYNSAHSIQLGSTYQFIAKFTPSGSSDKAYWMVEDDSILTVSSTGFVTPKKKGVTRLTVSNVDDPKQAQESQSTYTIFVRVVDKTEQIDTVSILSTKEMRIVFTGPIDRKTVIDDKNELKNIIITPSQSDKNITSQAPGTLKAKLLPDKKTLVITPSNMFIGIYNVKVTNGVRTTGNVAVIPYEKEIKLEDKQGPDVKRAYKDISGDEFVIEFTEAIDISNLNIRGAYAINNSSTTSLTNVTKSVLQNSKNYKLSTDLTKLTVDLRTISYEDRNKSLVVLLSGITDLSQNAAVADPLYVTVPANSSNRPQIVLENIERTSTDTITAKFSDSVQSTGTLIINGHYCYGTVDEKDKTVVKYTMNSVLQTLYGYQYGKIQGFSGYYVTGSNYQTVDVSIDFSTVKYGPVLLSATITTEIWNGKTYDMIVLTYDRDIYLNENDGLLDAKIVDVDGINIRNTFLNYTGTSSRNVVKLIIDSSELTMIGDYSIRLPGGFVLDYNETASDEIIANAKNY